MDVSENSATPKSSILTGFSIINHPFWGFSAYFWKHPYLSYPLNQHLDISRHPSGCRWIRGFSQWGGVSCKRVRHVLEMDRFIDVTIRAVHERERMVSVGILSTFTIWIFSEIRFKKFLEFFLWVIKRSDKEKTPFFQRGCEEWSPISL